MDNYSNGLAFLGGLFFILLIVGIILYVIMALGMYAMASKLRIENPWLAWIPVANIYLMGKIAGDQITLFKKDIPKLGLVLVIGAIAIGIISAIPVIGQLACIAYAVLSFATMYKIYRIFAEKNAVLYLVLSIIINVTAPFLILVASKNEPDLAIFNGAKSSGFSGSSGSGETPVYTRTVIPEPVSSPAPEPVVADAPEPVVETAPEPAMEPTTEPEQAEAPAD